MLSWVEEGFAIFGMICLGFFAYGLIGMWHLKRRKRPDHESLRKNHPWGDLK